MPNCLACPEHSSKRLAAPDRQVVRSHSPAGRAHIPLQRTAGLDPSSSTADRSRHCSWGSGRTAAAGSTPTARLALDSTGTRRPDIFAGPGDHWRSARDPALAGY